MSAGIEATARALYDCCPTVKPSWDQLGDVTKSVWRERAERGEVPGWKAKIDADVKVEIEGDASGESGTPVKVQGQEEAQGSLF